jgi:hypothetical protein
VAGSPAQQEQQQVFEQGFDLPLAIALAAAAFEAYLEPSGVDPQLIQTLRNETYVTYTDRWEAWCSAVFLDQGPAL